MWKFPTKYNVFLQQQNFAMGSLPQISSGAKKVQLETTRFRTRFRRVLVQIPREVPEGSGEDTCWGSGGFCAVPDVSGADNLWCSGGFACRYLVMFRRVPVQIPCEVPEVSGAGSRWGSGGLESVRFRRVTVQILGSVLDSRGFWQVLVRFRKFPVQLQCLMRFRRI